MHTPCRSPANGSQPHEPSKHGSPRNHLDRQPRPQPNWPFAASKHLTPRRSLQRSRPLGTTIPARRVSKGHGRTHHTAAAGPDPTQIGRTHPITHRCPARNVLGLHGGLRSEADDVGRRRWFTLLCRQGSRRVARKTRFSCAEGARGFRITRPTLKITHHEKNILGAYRALKRYLRPTPPTDGYSSRSPTEHRALLTSRKSIPISGSREHAVGIVFELLECVSP